MWERCRGERGARHRREDAQVVIDHERKDLLNSKEKVLPDAIPSGERNGQGVQKEKD